MKVTLVNHTPNPEAFISYVARVSNPANQDNPDYAKLIAYLIKHKHYSPFEHAMFTFEIVTSRAIAAQILRHRSFSFQEYSQRYSATTDIEPVEVRKQALKNRQSSTDVFDPVIRTIGTAQNNYDQKASEAIVAFFEQAKSLYLDLRVHGVAKEVARMVMPLATQTTIYMTGNVRSWIHYLALRTAEDTQKEHRDIACAVENILRQYLPTVFMALDSIRADEASGKKLLQTLSALGVDDEEFLELLLLSSPHYKR